MMALVPPIRPSYSPIRSRSPPCVSCSSPGDLVALQCPEQLNCGPSDQLTAQCTDQCVVIACSDPEHTELICGQTGPHTQCDFVCDETVDCLDCHGFDAFVSPVVAVVMDCLSDLSQLQCCDDYKQYGSDSARRGAVSTSAPIPTWETAFADWCAACAGTGNTTGPAKVSGKSGEGSGHAFLHDASFQASSSGSVLAVSSFSNQSPPPAPADCACMWAGCTAKFTSLSELVGHVNLVHLMSSSSSSSTPKSSPSDRDISSIACQWDNCSSSYYSASNSFELLAHHLLNDHLHAEPTQPPHRTQDNYLLNEHSNVHQYSQPHLPQERGSRSNSYEQQIEGFHRQQHQHSYSPQHQPSEQYQQQPEKDAENEQMRFEQVYVEQLHAVLAGSSSITDFASLPDSRLPPSESRQDMELHEPLSQITASNNHDCGGARECHWKGCGVSFHSCDSLTTHINDVHIGGGKAHYECFWEQCSRNGTQGFQSKQKISRHVQVRCNPTKIHIAVCSLLSSHIQDIGPSNVPSASKTSRRRRRCSSISDAIHKRVSAVCDG